MAEDKKGDAMKANSRAIHKSIKTIQENLQENTMLFRAGKRNAELYRICKMDGMNRLVKLMKELRK